MMSKKSDQIICTTTPTNELPATSAQAFLEWADQDLKGADQRNRGNAISNIKKAIHSRTDEIIAKTHVTYAKDWNPRSSTEDKIDLLKKLKIDCTNIVAPLTKVRDVYEHRYIVPTLDDVRLYRDVAKLWIEDNARRSSFARVAIIGLPIKEQERVESGGIQTITKISYSRKKAIIVLSDYHNKVFNFAADGTCTERLYSDHSWKELLAIEAPAISAVFSNFTTHTQENVQKIVLHYGAWLSGVDRPIS